MRWIGYLFTFALGIVVAVVANDMDADDTAPQSSAPPPPPPPSPAPRSTPRQSEGLGAGVWLVGKELAPGSYRTAGPIDADLPCIWSRLSGTGGTAEEMIAGDLVNGPATVTVAASDVAFKTEYCQPWK